LKGKWRKRIFKEQNHNGDRRFSLRPFLGGKIGASWKVGENGRRVAMEQRKRKIKHLKKDSTGLSSSSNGYMEDPGEQVPSQGDGAKIRHRYGGCSQQGVHRTMAS